MPGALSASQRGGKMSTNNNRRKHMSIRHISLAVLALASHASGLVVLGGRPNAGAVDMDKFKPVLRAGKPHITRHLHPRADPVYNPATNLCICDQSRFFGVPLIPDAEKPSYCFQICGRPLEGVPTNIAPEPEPKPDAQPAEPTEDAATPSSTTASSEPTAKPAPSPKDDESADEEEDTPVPIAIPDPSTSAPPATEASATSLPAAPGTPEPSKSDNTGLKIGVGVAVGIIVALLAGLGVWFFLRRRKHGGSSKKHKRNHSNFGCVGAAAVEEPSTTQPQGEKYVYATSTTAGKGFQPTLGRSNPPSPGSIPPAYSAPPTGISLPSSSSTNSSTSTLSTNPPILPLGAPSRALDLNSQHPAFQPGNLTAPKKDKSPRNSAVQPPSITFFLHPTQNDGELDVEEKKWLDEEARRIREKKEAVVELERLRGEEEEIRRKIREKMRAKGE